MSATITPYNFHGHEVRTLIAEDGEPRFVLGDLCAVLDITNPTMVARRIDDLSLSQTEVENTRGQMRQTTIVDEAGMYEVILRSDKPEAAEFRRWVTREVLPSIRKHGGYLTPEKVEEVLLNPDTLIQLATNLKEEQAKRLAAEREAEEQAEIARLAEEELEAQAPAVSYYDTFVDERGALTFADVASTLGVKQSEMRQQLLDHNWIFRQRAWKRSASTGKRVPDYLYCERADKKPYFIRKKRHNAPLWKGRVRHTLFITPAGAEAIDRAMYRWADTDDAEDQEVLW